VKPAGGRFHRFHHHHCRPLAARFLAVGVDSRTPGRRFSRHSRQTAVPNIAVQDRNPVLARPFFRRSKIISATRK